MYRTILAGLALVASSHAVTHNIDVGENGRFAYEPNELTAKAGDQLKFHFYEGPHNVVQGSLDQPGPCQPSTDAFFSGRMAGNSEGKATFTVNVTSSDPIYFYCSVNRHCQGGMVGVVNPPSGGGYAVYRDRSRVVESSNQPLDVSGGVVNLNDDDDEGDDDNSHNSNDDNSDNGDVRTSTSTTRTPTQSSGTTGAINVATTLPTQTAPTTTTNGPATFTSPLASVTETAPSSAATTTPSGAGKNSQTPVVLGLAAVLAGLVALLA